MPTCQQYIQDACEEIGVGNPGDVLSANDVQMGLRVLSRMLNAWAADELTIAVTDSVSYTVTAGTATVTIGPTGNIARQRPIVIDQINYVIPGTNPAVEVVMGQMSNQQFENLTIKGLRSSYATEWYYQTSLTSANGTLTLWPVPSQNLQLNLYIDSAVPYDSLALTTTLTLPPGYQDAIHYDLAYRLCGPFGRPIPDGLPQLRQNALLVMKRVNIEPALLNVDSALMPTGGGAYNILSDIYTGSSGR